VTAHGLLRGIGRQSIGGPATISAYYLVALPASFVLGFVLDWKLYGLFLGLTAGLVL
jgi:MATE family multidrug resistance protein